MKKIIAPILTGLLLTSAVTLPVLAKENGYENQVKPQTKKVAMAVPLKKKLAKIIEGTVSNIVGSVITVSKNGITYLVNADSAKIFSKSWQKVSIGEIKIGDKISAWGNGIDDTTLTASMIRDLSSQLKRGVFNGKIVSINEPEKSLVMTSAKHGEITVQTDDNTKIESRKGKSLELKDLVAGQRVKVSGTANFNQKQVTQVRTVRDLSD